MGEGIRASGVPRSEIFVRRRFFLILPAQLSDCLTNLIPSAQITSKLWGTFHKNLVEECLDQSLANLGIDYLDRELIGDSEAKNRCVNTIYQCISSTGLSRSIRMETIL